MSRTAICTARKLAILFVLLAPFVSGCRQDMHDQPRYEALESSAFFSDGRASRQPVKGTVARGHLRPNTPFFTGKAGDSFVTELPIAVETAVLQRGRERYDIFCSPCHDRVGTGNGMVVRRGLSRPPSFHVDRLRKAEVGYFYDVISNGFGRMYSYGEHIQPRDRWSIVAYIRALQLSQGAGLQDVPESARRELLDQEVTP